MVDTDTFLTALYVMADDFCKTQSQLPAETEAEQDEQDNMCSKPGPDPSLYPGEVVCLAVFSQFGKFASERDFYRYASRHLLTAFPRLPHRTQFNRLLRRHYKAIAAFALYLARLLKTQQPQNYLYEALDTSALPTRDAKRRGAGWLCEYTNIGYSGRIGWYEGFHLLTSVTPVGAVTG
jgi:hypothetical protein